MCKENPIAAATGRKAAGAFTLIEMLIVVAILGLLGAVVIPRFSDASQVARENTLKDELRYLRTQVVVFKAQHRDTPPGYPNGNRALVPTEAEFIAQMVNTTNELCGVGQGAAFRFGPYLEKMPPNPMNGLNTVLIVPNGGQMPPAGMPDNSTGWIYKPETMEILANSPGVGSDGMAFVTY